MRQPLSFLLWSVLLLALFCGYSYAVLESGNRAIHRFDQAMGLVEVQP